MGAIVEVCGKKTDDMLSIKEAAVILGAGVSTVNKYVATGKIKACKVRGSKAHYIRVDDLNDFEQNGSLRTRNKKKPKEKAPVVPESVRILETMDDDQQKALLAVVGSVAKFLYLHPTFEQKQMAYNTVKELFTGTLAFDIWKLAPELMEV